MSLPESTKVPCNECPWRRDSTPGHLGPHSAEQWILGVHGEGAIACHMTITDQNWDDPGMRQCAGAAQFRKNVWKLPRDPKIAVAEERDTETVFAWNDEFLEHHNGDV